MLSDEHGVATKGCLLTVICNVGGRKAFGDKILGVCKRYGQAFVVQVGQVFALEVKAAAKARSGKCGKEFVQVSHKGLCQ